MRPAADDGTAGGEPVLRAVTPAVETWAHGTGADRLRLSVLAADAPAIALYERLGYVPDGGAGTAARETAARGTAARGRSAS